MIPDGPKEAKIQDDLCGLIRKGDHLLLGRFDFQVWFGLPFGCLGGFAVFLGIRGGAIGLGAVHDQGTAHEGLVVEDFDGAFGFIEETHGDKSVAFRAMGVSVVDNVDISDGADAFEKVFDVLLGGIVGEVADIETLGVDSGGIRSLALTAAALPTATFRPSRRVADVFSTWFAFFFCSLLARNTIGLTGGGLVETKEVQELFPKSDWFAWSTVSSTIAIPIASASALITGLAVFVVIIAVAIAIAIPVAITIPVAIPVSRVRGTLTG